MAKVRDLQQKGAIVSVKNVELTTLEGKAARSQVGENRPFVTGTTVGGGGFGGRAGGGNRGDGGPFGGGNRGDGGPGGAFGGGGMATQSIAYRTVGTNVRVKPEVGEDEQVTLEVLVEDSRMRASEGGAASGGDDKGTAGTALRTPEFITLTAESRLKVRPGHAVLVQGTKGGPKEGHVQTVVLVAVRTEGTSPKDGK
jgi:type II secretory pathway component GspD/PulD (secretin)